MIDTLDQVVVAKESTAGSFDLLPKGEYTVKLLSVSDWKSRELLNFKKIKFDDNFQKMVGPDGKDIIEIVPTVTVFDCDLKFAVVGGDFDGRWVYHRVSTYPNRPWEIPALLSGLGVPALKPSLLNTLVGTTATVVVDVEAYDKKVVDKDTGMESKEVKEKNVIKRFKAPKVSATEDLDSF